MTESAPTALGVTLDRLWRVVQSRRGADPTSSYTAKLLSRGPETIARKLGEESLETIIEAVAGRPAGVVSESADILYHLLALWAAMGVTPDQIAAELSRREGQSGIAEKSSRSAMSEG